MAKETFEKALKLAKGQDNTDIEEALQQTLTEIEKKGTSRQDNLTNEKEETGETITVHF